ncbi:MAG: hypothetical protein AB8H80_07295 [Planctomycetota bacterium]
MVLRSMGKFVPVAVSVAVSGWLLAARVPCQQGEPQLSFEQAEAKYRALRSRPSLQRRLEGRRLLAKTGDERAFALLQRDYAKPEDPDVFVRSVFVTMLAGT